MNFDKFKQLIAERQEIRRKNTFLQKKMVEFFKRRGMDHLIKEDSKGLDLESKYLKKLYELKKYKSTLMDYRKTNGICYAACRINTINAEEDFTNSQEDFRARQMTLAGSLLLRSNNKISTKAIMDFMTTQIINGREIMNLKHLEVTEKNNMELKRQQARKLHSLEDMATRSDYVLLEDHYERTLKKLLKRQQETKQVAPKTLKLRARLCQAKLSEQEVEYTLKHQQQRKQEAEKQMFEVLTRSVKLRGMTVALKEQEKKLQADSMLLTNKGMLQDFESTMDAINDTLKSLKKLQAMPKKDLISFRRPFNTPETDS